MIRQKLTQPLPRACEDRPSADVPVDPDVDRSTEHDVDAGPQPWQPPA